MLVTKNVWTTIHMIQYRQKVFVVEAVLGEVKHIVDIGKYIVP